MTPYSPRRQLLIAVALFALAFSFRAAYLFGTGKYRDKTNSELERAACTLARDGFLGNVFANDSGPSAHVVPLYACLLAGVHWCLGVKSLAAMVTQQLLAAGVTSLVIALLPWLARTTIERGCARLEWAALDWNTPALRFYDKLGAKRLSDWLIHRLDGSSLERVAFGPAETSGRAAG